MRYDEQRLYISLSLIVVRLFQSKISYVLLDNKIHFYFYDRDFLPWLNSL
jgi:hypothetical protein